MSSDKNKIESIYKELKEVNKNLRKLLLLIPEEGLEEYENSGDIKKSFSRTVRLSR